MRSVFYGAVLIGAVAAAAFAHTGVENPAVLARMQNMKAMADQMEILVPMARGDSDLEPHRIAEALGDLQSSAVEVPSLFHVQEMDPQSEALPELWSDFEDFEGRSEELMQAIRVAMDLQIDERQDLIQVVREIGSSCSGCHEVYRTEQ